MSGSVAAPTSPDRARKGIGFGRSGPIRSALRRALAEVRREKALSLEHELRAALAERHAALVDEAVRAGDGSAFLRASSSLLEILDTLPVRSIRDPGEEGAGGDSGGGRAKLISIMDSPPTVGDAAHS